MSRNCLKIENFYLPEQVKFVINRLNMHGFEAFAVGGCVRDTLMGRTPGDYDVATSALPEQMTKVFADTKTVETGLKHGTLTIVNDGMNVETTTYRVDGAYTDHRRPDNVTFTGSLELDLSRRDFTINAMAYNNGEIIDLFGGFDDIKDKIIRCVGRAEERFDEDGLRILRAIRFASVLDFTLDAECREAVHNMKKMLSEISRERIYVEITKLLAGDGAGRILYEYADVIEAALPGITKNETEKISKAFGKTNNGDKSGSDVLYALLISELSETDARVLIKSLKMSKSDERSVMTIYNNRGRFADEREGLDEIGVCRLIFETNDEMPYKLAQYMRMKYKDGEKYSNKLVKTANSVIEKNLPRKLKDLKINGCDIAERYGASIKRERYSELLGRMMNDVIRNRIQNDRETLLDSVGRANDEMTACESSRKKTNFD